MRSSGKSSFFRQSGWMVMATFIGGIFMVAVQIAAQNDRVMKKPDANTFIALLRLLIVFGGVPSAALQTIFSQQAAAAVNEERNRELTASVRAVLKTGFAFWVVVAGVVVLFAVPVAKMLGVDDPSALRLTMLTVLSVISLPVFKGLLQGLHRFTSLGWLQMLEGASRLGTFLLLVVWLGGRATGGVSAVFAGQYLTLAIAVWLTRDVWDATKAGTFDWKSWLVRGGPLTLGMGAVILLSSLDALYVKSLFFNATAVREYNCAMLIGYAVLQFIAPITAVMFPTIVRSLALSKKSDALVLTVVVTGVFGCVAAAGCTLFPRLPLLVLRFPLEAAPLVPWFAWAMLPLTLANVLVLNLMARGRFSSAPWLIAVPVLYGLTLMAIAPGLVALPFFNAFIRVIQTLGCFCVLLFVVAAWFSWREPASAVLGPDSAGARGVSDTASAPTEGTVS